MGLFSRGPEKVMSDGQWVRGRIIGIDIDEKSDENSTTRIDEYVVQVDASGGGGTYGVRQRLDPDEHVRLGMEVAAWVRGDDLFIDWAATMRALGLDVAGNSTYGWKGGRDATRTGVVDSRTGVQKALRKGSDAGTLTIEEIRWDAKFAGLFSSRTIVGVVTVTGQQHYRVELTKQMVPHYATHLPVAGGVLPVLVRSGRPDKVTIHWEGAVMQMPGIGVPPVDEQRPEIATQLFGGLIPDATGAAAGAGFTPPDPIEGVTWDEYLRAEKAILDSGGYGKNTGQLLLSLGMSQQQYAVVSGGFAKQMMFRPELQRAYAAALK